MPIHKINLPHSSSDLQDGPTLNSNPVSSVGLFRSSTKTSSLLSNVHSTLSLQSMISNHTATTEYSPNLIDSECGTLLKVTDLDIAETKTVLDDNSSVAISDFSDDDLDTQRRLSTSNRILDIRSKPQFDLNSDYDYEYDPDYNDDAESDISDHLHTPLRKTVTSNDQCGCSHRFSTNSNLVSVDYNDTSKWNYQEKWAFVLIGLPACGKSTMIADFQDYVRKHIAGKVRINSYNAGDIRRAYEIQGHQKFDFNDLKSSQKLRDFYAFEALKNLTDDLVNNTTDIGILDATNTTVERRLSVFNYLYTISKEKNIKINPLVFEIKCSNRALRRYNIEQKSKNKDYIQMNHDVAINDFLGRIQKYENSYEKVTIDEIKSLNVKYFGIDNVGDTIYYDCGLNHHDPIRHQNLTFNSIALNLLYQFLTTYRTNYAAQYLTSVDSFYTQGYYHPIKTSFSKPVSLDEVHEMKKVSSSEINSVSQMETKIGKLSLPKVLSSSRMEAK